MIDPSVFRRFASTRTLAPSDRVELAKHCQVRRLDAGEQAFRAGAPALHAVFLLDGKIELRSGGSALVVEAGDAQAQQALCLGGHYATDAFCLGAVQLLYIDRGHLDRVLTWSQAGTIEVRDLNEQPSNDWMAAMLASPVLQQVPPANIVRVIAAIEQVEFAAGESVIKFGAAGDYYYVLVEGECRVLRPLREHGDPVEVDRIGPGSGFGEEALVSGMSRNATVEAITNCRLVRLPGRDFHRFLREPLVQTATLADVDGGVQCVDVRLPEEFIGGHLPGARNVPLVELRARCSEIDADQPVIVYCDGGGRSASATFLLRERGYNARWLEGGVSSVHLTER